MQQHRQGCTGLLAPEIAVAVSDVANAVDGHLFAALIERVGVDAAVAFEARLVEGLDRRGFLSRGGRCRRSKGEHERSNWSL